MYFTHFAAELNTIREQQLKYTQIGKQQLKRVKQAKYLKHSLQPVFQWTEKCSTALLFIVWFHCITKMKRNW